MKYRTNQYSRLIEPFLYTKSFEEPGEKAQVLENIVHRERKELEFESNLYYFIGEQILIDSDTFTIENIIKPINESGYIELILEDEDIYCDDYNEKAKQILAEFQLSKINEDSKDTNLGFFKRAMSNVGK